MYKSTKTFHLLEIFVLLKFLFRQLLINQIIKKFWTIIVRLQQDILFKNKSTRKVFIISDS